MSNQNQPNKRREMPTDAELANVASPAAQQEARKAGGGGNTSTRMQGSPLTTLEKVRENELKSALKFVYRASDAAQRSDAGQWVMKRTKSELGSIANMAAWVHKVCLEQIDDIKTAEAAFLNGYVQDEPMVNHGETRTTESTSHDSARTGAPAQLEDEGFKTANSKKDYDDVADKIDQEYEDESCPSDAQAS